jgi:SsrA-binding protein
VSPPRSDAADAAPVARNPKARHDYHILETWEAGLVLTGSEIKSIRSGKLSLKEAYGHVYGNEVWLEGMNVSPYESGGYINHVATRRRKLLLHKKEIRKLIGAVAQQGLTLVPLDLHFKNGRAKLTLALGRGKKEHDKRETLRRRQAERDLARVVGRRR